MIDVRCPFRRKFGIGKDGPPQIEKGVAKTFSIIIMRLPAQKLHCLTATAQHHPSLEGLQRFMKQKDRGILLS